MYGGAWLSLLAVNDDMLIPLDDMVAEVHRVFKAKKMTACSVIMLLDMCRTAVGGSRDDEKHVKGSPDPGCVCVRAESARTLDTVQAAGASCCPLVQCTRA